MEVVITQNKQELERLEGIITRNLKSFYEVGRALMEIRDNRLYEKVRGIATFETYCKERWDFKRTYAFYMIESARVIDNVHNCEQRPATESQTRPLVRLEPQQQREAWQQAVDTAPEGKVTAAHVYKIVKGLTGKEKTGTNKAKQNPARHFSNIAINALKNIAIDDPAREDEFSRVALWIVKNRRREK